MDAERLKVLVGFAAVCGASFPSSCLGFSHTRTKLHPFYAGQGIKGGEMG